MDTSERLRRKAVALFAAILLGWLPLAGADSAAIKARLRELHAKGTAVRIELADGTKLVGSLVRVDADTVTVADEKSHVEKTIAYTDVARVNRKGLSKGQKAVLFTAVIGGGILLVLCVAPYPIGYLCRADSS